METAREESALNMFRQMDLKGRAKDDLQLKTTHQNTISTTRIYEEAGDNVPKCSSAYSSPNLRLDDTDTNLSQRRRWQSRDLDHITSLVLVHPWRLRLSWPAKFSCQ